MFSLCLSVSVSLSLCVSVSDSLCLSPSLSVSLCFSLHLLPLTFCGSVRNAYKHCSGTVAQRNRPHTFSQPLLTSRGGGTATVENNFIVPIAENTRLAITLKPSEDQNRQISVPDFKLLDSFTYLFLQ